MKRLLPHFCYWIVAGLALGQANDDFANRLPVTGHGVSVVSDTRAATRETGEPAHAGEPGTNRTLWWTWTPTASGPATLSLFGSLALGSSTALNVTGAALAVYTGDALPALTEVGSSNYFVPFARSYLTPVPPGGPVLSLEVSAGTTYQIALSTDTGETSGLAVLNIDQPPTIFSPATAAGSVGASFRYQIAAANQPTGYGAVTLPPGLVINPSTGLISGRPLVAGVFTIPIFVVNAASWADATLTLTVDSAPAVALPSLSLSASYRLVVGQEFSVSFYSFDALLSVSGLPPGLSRSSPSQSIGGVPTTPGIYFAQTSATNEAGTITGTIKFIVEAAARVPVVTSAAVARASVGTSFSYRITGSPVPSSYSAGNLPPGLVFAPGGDLIGGIPTVAGRYSVPISAANASGMGSAVLTIDVAPPAAASEVVAITSSSSVSGSRGLAFSHRISATGNPDSFSAVGLPPGLSINAQTGDITGVPLVSGDFTSTLTASGAGGTATGTLTILIQPIGASPAPLSATPILFGAATAEATVGVYFSHGFSVQFGGSGYSTSSLSYSAVGLPPGLSVSSSGGISGEPTTPGTYDVTYYNSTSTGSPPAKGSAKVRIFVKPAPGLAPPLITSPLGAKGRVGASFSYSLPQNGATYTVTGLPAGLSKSGSTISGTPQVAGVFPVAISATNASGTDSATVTFSIGGGPVTPVVTSDASVAGTVGLSLSHSIYVTDAPTLLVSNLPPGLTLNGPNKTVSGVPTTPGVFVAPVTASGGGPVVARVTYTIAAAPPPPTITSSAAAQEIAGQSFFYGISATGSATSYGAANLPPGLSVNAANGAITGTPISSGVFIVPISATNAGGTSAATLTITVAPTGPKPVISDSAVRTGTVGFALSEGIGASNSPQSYGAAGLPPGLTLNPASGAITGTPTTAGVFSVPVSATNPAGTATATLTFSIAATAAGPAPEITSAAGATGLVGAAFAYTIVANGSPSSFGASNLTPGLSLNPATGAITGTPTAGGPFGVSISASNANGTSNAVLTLVVAAAPTAPPTITSSAGAASAPSAAFHYQITGTNLPTSFGASGLPAGLTLDSATGLIFGVPTATGTFSVALTATNAAGTGSAVLRLAIAASAPGYITSSTGAAATVGRSFSYQFQTSPSANYLEAWALPPGVSFDLETRRMSGVPSVAGTYSVIATLGGVVSGVITVVVAPADAVAPVITSQPAATAFLGTNFSYAVISAGSAAARGVGALPPGLAFDAPSGTIWGRPTAPGAYSIPISATNAAGTGEAILSLTIGAVAPVPVIISAATVSWKIGDESFSIFSYAITASNAPGAFSATGLPPGLALDPHSGIVTGTPTTPGTYSVPITAANGGGTGSATVTFTIEPRSAPKGYSPAMARGTVGVPFTANIGFSDEDAHSVGPLPLGLVWNQASETIAGVPLIAGTFSVSATATNASGSASIILTIAIGTPTTTPPVFSSNAAAASGKVGQALQLRVWPLSPYASAYSWNDPSPALEVSTESLPPGVSFHRETGEFTGVPTAAGIYPVTFNATTAGGSSSVVITLVIGPAAIPVIRSAASTRGTVGESFFYTISGEEAPTAFGVTGLPPGLSLSAATGRITGRPVAAGNYPVTLTATNATGTTTATARFIISGPVPASIPRITSSTSVSTFGGIGNTTTSIAYTITATGSPNSFSAGGLPPGVVLNSETGEILGTPRATGIFPVAISATNAVGTGTATLMLAVTNREVTASPPMNIAGRVGESFSKSLIFLNPFSASGYLPAIYSANGLPPGLSLNTTTAVVSGTPAQAGIFPVTFTVRSVGQTSSATNSFLIAPALPNPAAPAIVSLPAGESGAVNVPYVLDIAATGRPLSFAASALPPGLSLSTFDGGHNGAPARIARISGTPTTAGNYVIPISAENAAGTATATLTLRIVDTAEAPIFSRIAAASGTVGKDFAYTVRATTDAAVADAPVIHSATDLPPGLTISASDGVISGRPRTAGVFPVTVSAVRGGVSGSALVTLHIAPNPSAVRTPQISAAAGVLGFVGVPFSMQVTADGDAGELSAALAPPGLSFAIADGSAVSGTKIGTLAGVPTTAGNYVIPISASNAEGSSSAVVTVTIVTPQVALPALTLAPIAQSVVEGQSASFTSAAVGMPAPTWQWLRNGAPIAGAHGPTFTLANATLADAATYQVQFTNTAGSVTSAGAALEITTTYDTWRARLFTPAEIASGLAAASADYNRDGLRNLLEYALNRDPRTGAGGSLPVVSGPDGMGRLQIVFVRDRRKLDLTYVIEASHDLSTWLPIARSTAGAPTVDLGGAAFIEERGAPLTQVLVQSAPDSSPRRFLRLRVLVP